MGPATGDGAVSVLVHQQSDSEHKSLTPERFAKPRHNKSAANHPNVVAKQNPSDSGKGGHQRGVAVQRVYFATISCAVRRTTNPVPVLLPVLRLL